MSVKHSVITSVTGRTMNEPSRLYHLHILTLGLVLGNSLFSFMQLGEGSLQSTEGDHYLKMEIWVTRRSI